MAISRSYPLLHIFGNTWSQLQETGDGFRQLWMITEKPLLNNHFRICKGSSVKRLQFVLRRSGRVWRERSQNAWGLQWGADSTAIRRHHIEAAVAEDSRLKRRKIDAVNGYSQTNSQDQSQSHHQDTWHCFN